MPASLTDFPAGHQFPATSFTITPEMSRAYREATGDCQGEVYAAAGNAVPPLAVAALALGELLKVVRLPEGSLHASESLEARRVVPDGSEVVCSARLVQRSVRGGYVWSVIESELSVGSEVAVVARATVLSPAATEARA
ncbi:MAG TPA: MaoC family dehydratase [Dehalococcoidia bacterium]|nr:MaoC family dehydratase [Dehalococcoidia bacterium]